MSDVVLVAVVGGISTVIVGLLGVVIARINQVHVLVNSTAAAQQAKIDAAAQEIAELKAIISKGGL